MRDAVLSCAVLRAALDRLSQLRDTDHDADVLREAGAKIDAGMPLDAAEGILTAAHPALARALAGASAWTKRVSMVLEWQARKVVAVASRMLYLATFRLPEVVLNDEALQVDLIHNVHLATPEEGWNAAATLVMDEASSSASPLVQASYTFFMEHIPRWFVPMDFFSDCDLAVILLGSDCIAKIAPGMVLPEDVQSQAMAVAATQRASSELKVAIRKRLFIIGLHRYEQWMHNQARRATPAADPVATGYEDVLKAGKTPDNLRYITDFLSALDVATRKTSLEDIVLSAEPVLGQKVVMRPEVRRHILSRLLPVDSELLKVLTLPNEDPRDRMTHLQPLAVAGGPGSGKTLSLLALASDPDVLCIYMTASEVLSRNGGTDVVATRDVREKSCAELLFKALRGMHAALEAPLVKRPQSAKKRAVIMVDDAGPYPNLVNAMCSVQLLLDVKLPDGTTLSFAEYLGVAHTQLVVAGRGMSVEEEMRCGSMPPWLCHSPVKWLISWRAKIHFDDLIRNELPWLAAVLSRDAAGGVRMQLTEAEDNPRMHACVASKLIRDPKSMFASDAFKKEASELFADHRQESGAMAERQHAMTASIVQELERCIEDAKGTFQNLS